MKLWPAFAGGFAAGFSTWTLHIYASHMEIFFKAAIVAISAFIAGRLFEIFLQKKQKKNP